MAGERALPGLGLTGYWDLGDNTWRTGNDTNTRSLSALVQPFVDSILATLPGAPTQGDIHIASGIWGGGSVNDIMIYDNAGWVNITPGEGWEVHNRETSQKMVFDGTDWIRGMEFVLETGLTYALADADLSGRRTIKISNAGAVVFTVTASLISTGPVTIINTGGGTIQFVEDVGVTVNATNMYLSTQYAWATLVPEGADIFYLGGALEAAP